MSWYMGLIEPYRGRVGFCHDFYRLFRMDFQTTLSDTNVGGLNYFQWLFFFGGGYLIIIIV